MRCYPAIDIRGGRCVRLLQGDFAAETEYGDPLELARAYVDAGAEWLHVVDLDAARTGEPANRQLVLAIAAAVGAKVQAGGGVRDARSAETLLDGGVARVVLGTAAVEQPAFAAALAERYPGQIALGLDYRAGAGVVLRGWEVAAGLEVGDALEAAGGAPFGAVVVTSVARDGTLAGPDLAGLSVVLAATELPVIASGGVGGAADLRTLAGLRHGDRKLEGAVVGRALLSGALGIGEALAACAS